MKKTVLSVLLTIFCAVGLYAGVRVSSLSGATDAGIVAAAEETEKIDYAGQVKLDLSATDHKTQEVTVKTYVDGDTTHFNFPGFGDQDTFKARYAAVNTPESTGKLEEWGKKAARFTRTALETATSIILESEGADWQADSTGTRYLAWVWYKAPGATEYRNLNVELLQEGLALGSKAGNTRYGEVCTKAIAQANQLKLHIYSNEKDPEFFYGESIELDLKELRLNIKNYQGKRVAFEGVVAYYYNQGVYVEDYDEETDMYYGVYVYYGFFLSSQGVQVLNVGNKVRVTGVVQYYEAGDSYQVSDLKYNAFMPSDDDIRLIETGHQAANVETAPSTFTKSIVVKTEDGSKTYKYPELALNTSISMKGLKVTDVYTTQNGGDNDGAMTLTCKADGRTITVRTIVLRDSTGKLATADMLLGKTIDVTGVIDYFDGSYQIKILSVGGIKIDGNSIFASTDSSDSASSKDDDEKSDGGCGNVLSASALLPMLAIAAVVVKKRKK